MKILRLLICCIALGGFIAGCSDSDNANVGGNNGAPGPGPQNANSLFSPTADNPVVPFPDNILFADADNISGPVAGFADDGTLNVPNTTPPNPAVTDVDRLDGFSTISTIYTDLAGDDIDMASANGPGVLLIDTSTGEALTPGTDFEVVQSPVVVDGTRLLIRPLTPLKPATTYVVALTDSLRTASGGAVQPSAQFRIVASPDPVGSENNPASDFTAAQRAVLEQIRTTQVRPIFDNVIGTTDDSDDAGAGGDSMAGDTGVRDADSIVLTWNFTTQSIGDSLDILATNPTPNPGGAADGGIRVQPLPDGNGGQLTPENVQPGAGDAANIFQGTVDLSYYLADDDAVNDEGTQSNDTPLNTFWQSNGDSMAGANSALPAPSGDGNIPCAALSASESTTKCFPTPRLRSVESVPVLVAVPNENSPSQGDTPDDGWPVVIFQHGITADRTNIFAVASTLANAGFVTVAIDLPLHGLAPDNDLAIEGAERTFDLDADGDGNVDSSGANFIRLQSPITTRDNNREAVVDLINLNATLMASDITVANAGGGNDNVIDLNGNPSQYLGHSLGAIVGGVLAGVTPDTVIDAVTLANPGGGTTRLLDGSVAFGATIAGGLAASGAPEGSQAYENFLRLNQTINDSADPINYAVDASASHDVHMIEIVGGANDGNNPPDLVVPNAVVRNVATDFNPPVAGACPATAAFRPFLDTVCVAGPLSGTDPLVAAMGLNSVTVQPPFAAGDSQPADTVVRFTSGHHSSILDPTPRDTPGVDPMQAAATTAEIQREAAGFLGQAAAGSANPTIPIGAAAP